MRLALPVLTFLSVPLLAQTPDVAASFARIDRPTLLLLAQPGAEDLRPLSPRDLMEAEGLAEVGLRTALPHPKDPRLDALHWATRAHLGLPDASWALLAPGGACVASGTRHLREDGLRAALQKAHLQTPIQQLQAFLKVHPEHLEARERLLARLRTTAQARTRLALGPAARRRPAPQARELTSVVLQDSLPRSGASLTAEQDLRIWGALYEELNRAYQSGDWLYLALPPELPEGASPFLPEATPMEAASPLMKGLFRRHRDRVVTALRETPADTNVLSHWLWTSLVLEEPLFPIFEGLKAPLGQPAWPGETLRRALVSEAAARADWPRLHRLASALWTDAAAPSRLSSPGSGSMLQLAWTEFGRPALEACLRSRALPEADALIDSVRETPEAAALLADAAGLAQRLGHPDLAATWRALPPKAPLPEPIRVQVAVLRSALNPGLVLRDRHGYPPIRLHPDDPERSPRADAWRAFLGWGPRDLNWAAVAPNGRVLLRGAEPLAEHTLKPLLDDLRLPDPLDEASQATEDGSPLAGLDPWHQMTRIGPTISDVLLFNDAQSQPATGAGKATPLSHPAADLERLRALQPALQARLWARKGCPTPQVSVASAPRQIPGGMEALARPWVEALEAELMRRPSSPGLWSLWSLWVRALPDHPIASLLSHLDPGPLATSDHAFGWPPVAAIGALEAQCMATGHWGPFKQAIRPLWTSALARRPGGLDALPAEPVRDVGLPLAHCLLALGRPEEADAILADALRLGMKSRGAVADLARQQGYAQLADRWAPPGRSL